MVVEESVIREHVVSFRDEVLPPCWLPIPNRSAPSAAPRAEQGLWPTEREGRAIAYLVQLIGSAKEVVCVASFLLSNRMVLKALLAASDRGVRVYVLTASEKLLQTEAREDSEFEIQRVEEHKKTLNSLAGKVLVRTAENLHTKFVLVDPMGAAPRGVLSTANLTDEAMVRNLELLVALSPDAVRDLFHQFLIGFWIESRHELFEADRLRITKAAPNVPIPPPTLIPCTTSDIHTLKAAVIDLVGRARTGLWVSTFGLEMDHEASSGILEATKKGVPVRIITRPRHKRPHMEALVAMASTGAQVRGHPWLHAKALWVGTGESDQGLVMTANIERHGLDEGFESGVILDSTGTEALRTTLNAWWDQVPYELQVHKKLGDVAGEATLWKGNRLVKIMVRERLEMDLGDVQASSIESMEITQPPQFPPPPAGEALYHEVRYVWTVRPPKALKGSGGGKGA